jgi:hypothetical protein
MSSSRRSGQRDLLADDREIRLLALHPNIVLFGPPAGAAL